MATGRINDLWHRKDRTRTTRYGTGKRWQAVWTNDQGKETKKSFTYKDAAQQWLDAHTIDSTLNPYGLKPDQLFEDYYQAWRERQAFQRPNSLKTIDSHFGKWIVPSFSGQYLKRIQPADVQAAVNHWRDEGNAASTTKLMLKYTRQVFNEAVHDKIIRESPCKRIRVRDDGDEEPVFSLSEPVFQSFLDHAAEPYRTAGLVAAATGLRPKELIGLCKTDVDFPRSMIRLTLQDASRNQSEVRRGALKTKYSKRSVTFGPALRDVLKKLCDTPGPGGRLFHEGGKPLLYPRFSGEWERVREIIPEIGPGWHQLRHYHASVLIARGVSPVAVAARLGHKDATVTLQVYSHLWMDDTSVMAGVGDSILLSDGRSATEPPQVA